MTVTATASRRKVMECQEEMENLILAIPSGAEPGKLSQRKMVIM